MKKQPNYLNNACDGDANCELSVAGNKRGILVAAPARYDVTSKGFPGDQLFRIDAECTQFRRNITILLQQQHPQERNQSKNADILFFWITPGKTAEIFRLGKVRDLFLFGFCKN